MTDRWDRISQQIHNKTSRPVRIRPGLTRLPKADRTVMQGAARSYTKGKPHKRAKNRVSSHLTRDLAVQDGDTVRSIRENWADKTRKHHSQKVADYIAVSHTPNLIL